MPKIKTKSQVAISIDHDLLKAAKEAAKDDKRSFSNWVCLLIEAAVKPKSK